MGPLVSLITPTWQRHGLLNERCIPSVQGQSYPNVEHVIVSDGPDDELATQFKSALPPEVCQDIRQGRRFPVWFHALAEHQDGIHWGTAGRLAGIELAAGDFIGYVDDDDELRPEHCELLVQALIDHPEAGWARSLMISHQGEGAGLTTIGHGEPSCGNIGTPMIMHRREILEHGTWGPPSAFEDWELVNRWVHAGISHVKVDVVTVDVYPSVFWGAGR